MIAVAQFDVVRLRDDSLAVSLQHDLLSDLSTRVVVPLLPNAPTVAAHPRVTVDVTVDGTRYHASAQFAGAVSCSEIKEVVCNLRQYDYALLRAIDGITGGT